MLTPVKKTSLSDAVCEKLRESIVTGHFAPGAKLVEEVLARQMNTSRGPLRAAFLRLAHEGLVINPQNRSATVVRMTRRDVEEIHSLRLTLESMAVRRICRDGSAEDLEKLDRIEHDLLDSVGHGGPLPENVKRDLSFHETLVGAAHHERLLTAWLGMRSQVGLLIYSRSVGNAEGFSQGVARHQELIRGMTARDCARTEVILREHLEGLRDWALQTFGDEEWGAVPLTELTTETAAVEDTRS